MELVPFIQVCPTGQSQIIQCDVCCLTELKRLDCMRDVIFPISFVFILETFSSSHFVQGGNN